jgi:hypothetical protein
MKFVQRSKKDFEVEFDVHDSYEPDFFGCMSYELLNWTLRERCSICVYQNNCEIKKSTCLAAGNNYPFQSIYWLIIKPSWILDFQIKHFLPDQEIMCFNFDHVQSSLFPANSMIQQNQLLEEELMEAWKEVEEWQLRF